ncbi:hypothetical protein [Burkholderia cenocepacia]|uniref:hypothetical protein n=1 Tax=Burkholderia cenocepacia TaxID=95486 RepID=UPI00163ACFC7|nr:hypothetical protein [Burkholderia cenocepacia]
MSIESMFPPARSRSDWAQALRASLPCYVRRLFVAFVVVPAAVPIAGLAVLNLGSFTGMATTVLEQAAGSGTNPDTIRLRTCADTAAQYSPSAICMHWRTDDVPVATLARRVGRGLFVAWLVAAAITLAADLVWSPPSPLALRTHLDSIGRQRAERSRASREGEVK